MNQELFRSIEKEYMKAEKPKFDIGDTVNVHVRIREGDKERIQIFVGTVISRRGSGINEKFTVRRIVAGEGVERIFPMHSPNLSKLEVVRSGVTRRAKLYYLRDRVGKSTRLKERRAKKVLVVPGEETSVAEAPKAAAPKAETKK